MCTSTIGYFAIIIESFCSDRIGTEECCVPPISQVGDQSQEVVSDPQYLGLHFRLNLSVVRPADDFFTVPTVLRLCLSVQCGLLFVLFER